MPGLLAQRPTMAGIRLVRRVKTCRTERVLQGAQVFYWRRRPWWMRCVVPLFNGALRGTRPKVLLLETGPWQLREAQAHQRLNSVFVEMCAHGVLVPTAPGQSLDVWLNSRSVGWEDKLRALGLAMVALRTAHQTMVPTPHGVDRPFTHGDATCGNVVVALEGAHASWIDFESMHEETGSLILKQADDLRALIVSALERLEPGAFPAVWRLVKDAYPDPEVRVAVAEALRLPSRPIYHWAQGIPRPAPAPPPAFPRVNLRTKRGGRGPIELGRATV